MAAKNEKRGLRTGGELEEGKRIGRGVEGTRKGREA